MDLSLSIRVAGRSFAFVFSSFCEAVIYSLGTRGLLLVPSKKLSVGSNVKYFNLNVIKC